MKMLKKFLLLALTLVLLSGCGSGNGGSSAAPASSETPSSEAAPTAETTELDPEVAALLGETPRDPSQEYFGLSLPQQSSEYFKRVHDQLSSYCDMFNIKYDMASAEGDAQKQISQIENFMTMGCTTLIVYSQDVAANEAVLTRARNEGIRVVSATNTPSSLDSYDIAVDASQIAVGTKAAEFASAWVDEHYPDAEPGSVEVALFTMSLNQNVIDRCDGLRTIANNPKVTIVEDFDIPVDNYLVKVKENADLLMQTHPDVKVILTYSDAFNLVIDEAMMANPDMNPAEICSVAVDQTDATCERIKLSATDQSTIRATIASGEHFEVTMIQAALGAFDDQLNEKKQYFVEPFAIDASNVDQFLK